MERTRWTDRTFSFDFPEGWMPNIIERLSGTLPRLQFLLENISDEEACEKLGNKWSIKENIGHLCDLEELHDGRITDFLLRKKMLRAADMANEKTNKANHNNRSLENLFNEFDKKRNHFVRRLSMLDDQTQIFTCLHPRLNIPMRPVDVAFFTAEHDDHHLASIRELIQISDRTRSLFNFNS